MTTNNNSFIKVLEIHPYHQRWYNRHLIIQGKKVPDMICKCCNKIFNWGGHVKWGICPDCIDNFYSWCYHGHMKTKTKFTKTNIELFLEEYNYTNQIKKDNEEFMKDLDGNVRKTIEGMGL